MTMDDRHSFTPSRPDGTVCVFDRDTDDSREGAGFMPCGFPAGHPIHTTGALPIEQLATVRGHSGKVYARSSRDGSYGHPGGGKVADSLDELSKLDGPLIPFVPRGESAQLDGYLVELRVQTPDGRSARVKVVDGPDGEWGGTLDNMISTVVAQVRRGLGLATDLQLLAALRREGFTAPFGAKSHDYADIAELRKADIEAERMNEAALRRALISSSTTPAEARAGVSDSAAAALTDLAEVREAAVTVGVTNGWLVERLDRIEAALRVDLRRDAVQATAPDGRPLWQHACNATHAKEERPDGCSWCYKPGEWQPLLIER